MRGRISRGCGPPAPPNSPLPADSAAMPTHAEQRVLPYTPEQLFDLVADIERYPEFLPWCLGARIRDRQGDEITADLAIGFKVYRERFTSHVVLMRPGRIHVTYSEGPFRYLQNEWQ